MREPSGRHTGPRSRATSSASGTGCRPFERRTDLPRAASVKTTHGHPARCRVANRTAALEHRHRQAGQRLTHGIEGLPPERRTPIEARERESRAVARERHMPLHTDGVVTGSGRRRAGRSSIATRHRFIVPPRCSRNRGLAIGRPDRTPVDRRVLGHRDAARLAAWPVGGRPSRGRAGRRRRDQKATRTRGDQRGCTASAFTRVAAGPDVHDGQQVRAAPRGRW